MTASEIASQMEAIKVHLVNVMWVGGDQGYRSLFGDSTRTGPFGFGKTLDKSIAKAAQGYLDRIEQLHANGVVTKKKRERFEQLSLGIG